MSEWIEVEADDIDIHDNKDGVYIWFESDDFGNRYVSVESKAALKKLKECLDKVELN